MFLLLIPALIAIVIVSLVLYARWNYGKLEALGIPVVKPHFLLGSTYDSHLVVSALRDIEWMKKYGPAYGVYEGREAQVHVTDPELLRHIMVKDHDYFNARRPIDFGNPILNEMPDFLPGEKWKAVRQMMTPALSIGKIKNMSIQMNSALEDYVVHLKKQINASPNGVLEHYQPRDGFGTMMTDLALRCIFNIKVDGIHTGDSNNIFLKSVQDVLTGFGSGPGPSDAWKLSFPFLTKILGQSIFNPESAKGFAVIFKKLMKERQGNGTKLNDFTDYMMQLLEKVDTPEFKRLNITENTILCQALIFFFAGGDQVVRALVSLFYYVSQNPDIEEKICHELDEVLSKRNGVIDHECLSELTYLTACVSEALRFFPDFFRAERVCIKDWEMDGVRKVRIKKGMTVIIPIWAVNRNPKYFENPEEFNPERFMPANKGKLHPNAFTTFGHGPRNCIGMKFSYEAIILGAAHLFRDFKIYAEKGGKIDFYPGGLFAHMPKPLHFDISLR